MYFIGQGHIIEQLKIILPPTLEKRTGLSILLRGPSGYGKTELAKQISNYFSDRRYEFCLGNDFHFNDSVWVHFIDEIHLMKEPETLYPLIDLNKYIFIFATNYDSSLPEALLNRCKNFVFTEYENNELREIFFRNFNHQLHKDVVDYLIDVSGRNPRVLIKTFADTLNMYFAGKANELVKSPNFIIGKINQIFGIENGLDRISRQYLETLKRLGGRASLQVIVHTLKLDEATIKYFIEPILLSKKMIKITSKGRILC